MSLNKNWKNARKRLVQLDSKIACSHKRVLLEYSFFVHSVISQELVNRVLQLEAHNQQLRNVLKKEMNIDDGGGTVDNNRKKFDFTK